MSTASLSDLHAFACVARLRSFRRAAAELEVSPSALSHALRNLETRLGVRLLNRTTRSVAPTEAGERLLARLSPALRDIQGALDEVNAFRDSPLGSLRLNAPRPACELVLAPLVAAFLARHPGMQVELVADDALVDIVAAGFDAGVRFGERLQQDMVAIPIGPPQRFIVVASPDYLARHGVPRTPRDLTAHGCIRIRFPGGALYRWEFSRAGESLDIEVNGALTVGEMPLMIHAAERGLGLAYVYASYAADALAAGRLVSVLDDWRAMDERFYLYYPSRRLLPAGLRAFVDMVREQANRTG
ncbi:LysR family transcriptional regulator [Aquaspirillum sp. LM1]|jgi:DNA-binding transcriptional LysR family regulator|uniref:LysR family transcriptional regulator n=1 Tax=Aquaspirillum sp. LM1 TaxID=1938604 RepID=UPI000983B700|nr:LysR family transcriptional regulator [Aquaspirillum sp. LM1]AQR64417.1 LysR family transcriptional regulator [Aquaspirillum sp. LM1]